MTNRSVRLANPALLPRVVGMLHCVTVRGGPPCLACQGLRGGDQVLGRQEGAFMCLLLVCCAGLGGVKTASNG